MSFASLADYEKAFPGSVPDDSAVLTQLAVALAAACDDITKHCGQTFELVEGDVIVVHGTGSQLLLLPELPVVAVNAVTIDDGLTTETEVTDFRIDPQTGVLYRPCCWPCGFANVTVDYDHGYDPVPQGLIDIAVHLARDKVAAGPSHLRGETIAGYSYSQDGAPSVESYADVLEPYKQKRVSVG